MKKLSVEISESSIIKRLHVVVLVLGAILFAAVSVNTNIWFDECYSLAAVSNSLSDMPRVLTDDVHPFLYYFMLKAVSFVTNGSLIAMRLFSALGMWLLCLCGYTHVRAQVSEKAGFFFSLFCCLSPASFKYAGEIRMYSFGALFVFFSAFYAYMCVKEGMSSRRHCTLFVLSSVAAAYTHYYGLVTVCVINAFFLGAALIKKLRARRVVICAAAELVCYVPGAVVFLIQSTRVAAGDYWIRVKYPHVLFQTMSYAFTGGDGPWDCYLEKTPFVAVTAFGCVLFALCVFAVIRGVIKKKTGAVQAALALGVFAGVVGAGLLVSLFKEFYYVRYTMLMHGLLLAVFAFAASQIRVRGLKSGLCVLLSVSFCIVNVPFLSAMHNGDFRRESERLNAAFRDTDVLVFAAITPASTVSYMLDGGQKYFVNEDMDEYPRAYTAFANEFETVRDFDCLPDGFDGRVWLMVQDYNEEELTSLFEARYPDARRTDEYCLSVAYRHHEFKFIIYD